ncbi:DUF2958 domain-containing protein [Desulfovibrio sp. OttesenSCG-928-M14]|nr:DUF2958 domain-containing protein [Desulfovibrio sp. OttesenSCG-928-M14]
MWNAPTAQNLSELPGLYETEQTPVQAKVIHMHFFIGGCDWFVAEFDGEDLFFGYAVLNGDLHNAEWGYFSLSELQSIRIHGIEVDCDLYWEPVAFCEMPGIGGSHER